ncbi:MAG: hypothetical protein A4E72_01205 [Syntrophus sp. PtaU1.Bin208]|nr:MAG: hypothetical protein A4E72_01205 [Syntrophus sp. PtaU1.Bin208]
MRTMTMRNVGCMGARDAMGGCPFDLGRRLRRFQRCIETSHWDQWLIRQVARFDRMLSGAVILLAVAFFLSLSRTF